MSSRIEFCDRGVGRQLRVIVAGDDRAADPCGSPAVRSAGRPHPPTVRSAGRSVRRARRPQAAVGDYFAALDDHDAPAALAQLTPEVRATVGDGGQLARMVEAKGYQPPTDVSVTAVERDGDEAVAYTLGGQQLTAELSLRRDDSAVLGLFHRWRIAAAPASLALPGGPAPLTVNGVPAPTGPEQVAVPLLPGAYTVAGESNVLSETVSRVVYVVPGQQSVSGAELTPTLRPEAQSAAEQSVRSYWTPARHRRWPRPRAARCATTAAARR